MIENAAHFEENWVNNSLRSRLFTAGCGDDRQRFEERFCKVGGWGDRREHWEKAIAFPNGEIESFFDFADRGELAIGHSLKFPA